MPPLNTTSFLVFQVVHTKEYQTAAQPSRLFALDTMFSCCIKESLHVPASTDEMQSGQVKRLKN
ncbi:hypothetical protein SLEP1_g57461 [Rubroshorea leprosula]|uniref:Uncharacterized protein n=1 Tax=Rubroshorea leprosula TaxID=152421 RepID=A0AAV5MLA9_9ROSI|nr:hypothetical protein SLEP1_g57461 [Rubroshorea leprosula]